PFTFSGRATRSEHWWFVLVYYVASIVLTLAFIWPIMTAGFQAAAAGVELSEEEVLALMPVSISTMAWAWLFLLWPMFANISVMVRRLHDIGRSGWWYWIYLVPFVGWLILLIMLCMPSEGYRNQYGPPPKGTRRPGFMPSGETVSAIPDVPRNPIDEIRTAEQYRALRKARMEH
ncbi:MAG: DUF805 domain-containing protein, partial [Pseudomonadota bacterium]